MIYLMIAAGIFLLDYYIKERIEKKYTFQETKDILKGTIRLRKLHNKGAAFNLLEQYPGVTYYLSGAATLMAGIVFFILFIKKSSSVIKLAFSFILGGALSNLYDRKVRGYVVDYFSFQCKMQRLRRLVFNISDLFIFIGTIIGTVWDIANLNKGNVSKIR